MTTKKSGRKAPVKIAPDPSLRRRRRRGRVAMLDAQALAAPVPGVLLVLLSQLHRRKDSETDAEAHVGLDDPLPSDSPALSPRDRDL